jgi:alpha-amylase
LKKIRFCFGIHNHQPVGNFGWVIEQAYQQSYFPFLELLEKYPGIRISLHFSGVLFDWVKEHHPEGIGLIKRLVEKGQVELLTGGHFEPILPAIPDRDKIGQIAMQTEFIKSQFGVDPSGMWLAERVWEPNLPKILSQAGVKYTILDDIHFRYSGLADSQLNGYYLTEDEGKSLALFPISKKLRYAIPFEDPEVTLEYLRSLATEDCQNIAVYADDGEKFGVWPKTHEHCFVNGWLERFFRLISDNLDWIEVKPFGEILQEMKPLGLIYLPTASYSEMNEWAMPVAAIERYDAFVARLKTDDLYEENTPFVKGGFWRNFLSKYAETNNLHKRMLYVSDLLNDSRSSTKDYDNALRRLYAGQCNCPYWHGVFGGLYLPHLRGAVYQELVAAEGSIRRQGKRAPGKPTLEVIDFDCDGYDELIVTTPQHKAIIAPALGGVMLELDDFDVSKNLVDIVGRRREGYHKKLLTKQTATEAKSIHDLVMVKEEGLEQLLLEDWYRRGLFIDHFFGEGTSLAVFAGSKHHEEGGFINQPYAHQHRQLADRLEIVLERRGHLRRDGNRCPILLTKTLSFPKAVGEITAKYVLKNEHDQALDLHFGVEFGFGSYTFPMSESTISCASQGVIKSDVELELAGISSLQIESRLYQYRTLLSLDKSADLWTHPLWTVSLSEGGFEKVYQGAIIVPHWKVRLNKGESWQVTIGLNCARLNAEVTNQPRRVVSGQVPL